MFDSSPERSARPAWLCWPCWLITAFLRRPQHHHHLQRSEARTTGEQRGISPAWIKSGGAVTGSYRHRQSGPSGSVRYSRRHLHDLRRPRCGLRPSNGAPAPAALNDLGVVAGNSQHKQLQPRILRRPMGSSDLRRSQVRADSTRLHSDDLEGAIVGYYSDSNFSTRAFLRSRDGKFTTWIGPDACTGSNSEGCFGSGASNINAFGIVAGGFEDTGQRCFTTATCAMPRVN